MAKKKAAKRRDASAHRAAAGNGRVKEKLTNKAEAVRRALAKLGNKSKPAQIQEFIKTNFDVEMTTQAISVYKSVLKRRSGKKSKPRRKPKAAGAVIESVPKPTIHNAVSFKDMRAVKEISNRLGHARMRELVALMAD